MGACIKPSDYQDCKLGFRIVQFGGNADNIKIFLGMVKDTCKHSVCVIATHPSRFPISLCQHQDTIPSTGCHQHDHHHQQLIKKQILS